MFRKTLIAHALTIAFGGAALTMGAISPAMAQSNTIGTIVGKIENAAGTSISIVNPETGLKRTATPGADGRYTITALPPGRYKVTLIRNGGEVDSQEVEVVTSRSADASFAATQVVQISGRRKTIDVSNTTNGATFSAKTLKALPITPTVDSIIQLAPNTTRADSRYAAGAAIGGGGPSENAYYINGFPVTNPLSQLGASELPFGAIATATILSGGFGAEFGRSVGGVIDITTKSGTNNWEFGVSAAITPDGLRAKQHDLYYGVTGAAVNADAAAVLNPNGTVRTPAKAGTEGRLFRKREDNKRDDYTVGAFIGGPLIKDKLFMFISAETIMTNLEQVNASTALTNGSTTNGFLDRQSRTERYLGKFDFNITDNHRLELTLLGDEGKADEKLSGYTYDRSAAFDFGATGALSEKSGTRFGPVTSSAHYKNVANFTPVGAEAQILKYTGNLTNDLTFSALYGESLSKHSNTFDNYDINAPLFQVVAATANQKAGLNYTNPQPLTGNILPPGAKDRVKSFRLDIDYKLGIHTFKAGLDNNKLLSTNAGEFTAGGGIFTYLKTATPNTPINLSAGPRVAVATGGGLGTEGFYVRKSIFNDATSAESIQDAYYLQDKVQVTPNVQLIFGYRVEGFKNRNGAGEQFAEQRNQRAPRFAGSWDVNGDSSFKVFGSAGRYSLQVPTSIAIRGASNSTNTQQFFTYTGVDANGAPTGTVKLTEPRSANNEFGQDKDPFVVSAIDLRPTFQDELTLGFEKSLSPTLNVGVKTTFRKLKSTIDDFCDQRPFDAFAAKNNIDTSNWNGFACATFNPGEANTFLVDFKDGLLKPGQKRAKADHTVVSLSKADLGFDEAKRNYFAVDFFAEHPFKDGFYGKVNYTFSRSTGNTEGQTLSDVAQTDVALTRTWDHKEIMVGAEGLLPNDRTHQIKAFGFYEVTPEWIVGGNFLAASGRPINCLGNAPATFQGKPFDPQMGYGSAYHFCNDRFSPRGAGGKLPWDIKLDMNLVYRPAAVKGLALKIDVFNVFNKQTAQTIDETFNTAGATSVSPTYNRIISLTAPRSTRLTAEYNYKF